MSDLTLTATSGFASLLATEDISVVIDSTAETAYFDLESRRVIMPVWRNMSTQLTDMLIGHEVSHALHTTCDLPATIDHIVGRLSRAMPRGLIMGALNIVEDVRIDRLIQRRYRGLVSDYAVGYTEMRNMDLFGLKGGDPNEREFLDRLNLHSKGYTGEVTFSNEEQTFVNRAESTEEFGEVVDLVVDILNWLPESEQPQTDPQDSPDAQEGDAPSTDGDGQSAGEQSQSTGEQGDETENNASGDAGEQGGDESGEGSESGEATESKGDGPMESAAQAEDDGSTAEGEQGDMLSGGQGFDDQMPTTADAMADGLKNMAAKTDPDMAKWNAPVVTHMMPGDKDIHEDAFADRAVVRKEIDDAVESSLKDKYSGQQAAAELAKYDDWMADARVSVNQMAMEFERKQAAHIDQRTQVGKSGRLDMGKLHNYKLTEDLFMRTELRPNGKNHAMTIVIDWSGSMDDKTVSTMRQACILAMFCKKVNVPCEVYLFQSGWATLKDNANTLQGSRANARHIMVLNTADRAGVFNADVKRAWILGAMEQRERNRPNNWNRATDLRLGGTPLGASLFLAEKSHRDLIARTGAEVSSIIYLTDGEGCEFAQHGRESTHVTCPRTRRTFKGKTMDEAMLNWIRETLGCNIVNFFMDSLKRVENAAQNGFNEVAETRMKSVKTANFFERGEFRGWDNWLVVADNATADYDNGEDLLDALGENASKVKIKNAFIKQMSNRGMSRPLVNRITEMIA